VERYPDSGPALVFEVRAVAVTDGGWNAEVALRNETEVNWELDSSATQDFGVMLFPSDDAEELERLGVPVVRAASATAAPVPKSQTMLQGMEAESRQKLWRWFIAATLAVLLVESALAGWTARKSVKTAEVSS